MTIVKTIDLLWAPITGTGSTQQIVRRIGEAIGAGVYRPEEALPAETTLAKHFQVSLMTVRKALAVLRDEGYIETYRGRSGGSFVATDIAYRIATLGAYTRFTHESLQELTDWRCAISGEATARAAGRRHETDMERLRNQLLVMDDCTADAALFRMEDARFHIMIADIGRSHRLLSGEIGIQEELSRIIAPLPGSERVRCSSHYEHRQIVAHIQLGEIGSGKSQAVRHAESTFDWLIGLHLCQPAVTASVTSTET